MIDGGVLEKIKKRCGFDNGLCLSSRGNFGGMGLWWRDIKMAVISYSNNHSAADILNHDGRPAWRVFAIYGWPETTNKYGVQDMDFDVFIKI